MAEYFCHTACFQSRLDPSPRRTASTEIYRSPDGTITNAADLVADQVAGQRVLCPGCREMIFASWPEGWDAHATHKCSGVSPDGTRARKAEFKRRFAGLFRS